MHATLLGRMLAGVGVGFLMLAIIVGPGMQTAEGCQGTCDNSNCSITAPTSCLGGTCGGSACLNCGCESGIPWGTTVAVCYCH